MKLTVNGEFSQDEIDGIIELVKNKRPKEELESLVISIDENDNDFVNIEYKFKVVPFERIRRITGYLVGTTEKWNNAKQAELKDRLKHNIKQ